MTLISVLEQQTMVPPDAEGSTVFKRKAFLTHVVLSYSLTYCLGCEDRDNSEDEKKRRPCAKRRETAYSQQTVPSDVIAQVQSEHQGINAQLFQYWYMLLSLVSKED